MNIKNYANLKKSNHVGYNGENDLFKNLICTITKDNGDGLYELKNEKGTIPKGLENVPKKEIIPLPINLEIIKNMGFIEVTNNFFALHIGNKKVLGSFVPKSKEVLPLPYKNHQAEFKIEKGEGKEPILIHSYHSLENYINTIEKKDD